MSEVTTEQENNRNPDGTFKAGVSGNPGGRPKNSLKDYMRVKFSEMSDEEKEEWLLKNKVNPDTIWKMAEGLPSQHTDITSGGKPLYIPTELLKKNELDDNSSQSPEPNSK